MEINKIRMNGKKGKGYKMVTIPKNSKLQVGDFVMILPIEECVEREIIEIGGKQDDDYIVNKADRDLFY